MSLLPNRRDAFKTGLLAAGGLAVLSLSKAAALANIEEEANKAIVSRWFTDFWGQTCDLSIVDRLAAPNMLLKYSLHKPRRGRADIKAFMAGFRKAFPDLNFRGTGDLIADGDYVVGRWEGEVHIPALRSATFFSDLYQPRLAERCTSPEPRF